MSAGKSADPAAGSPLHTGDLVTYTLSFVNGTSSAIDIDTFDDLSGVLNHAEIVMQPTASNAGLDAVLASDRILITGKLPAGSRSTVTYAVRVLANDFRVTSEMVNTFAGCTPGETCETRHPIPPAKKPPKSPKTPTSLPQAPSGPPVPGGSESPAPPPQGW
ncbi:hypothetical protein G7067_00710 [Leucobacter insecticola]|uniref:DUF7927 domain-containing protein n=1 Tax=Leucobacter insecticola TaxID=2714934 RepID=A0A6G8FFV4_9MICO|nr:hypothetical protein [Leucobacter insecticola]QIM15271.1 hypothetical protein G7067_00710 [Leucobacter insecticola]